MINAAQKVRLWFILGLSILQLIAIIAIGAMPGYELALGQGTGYYGLILVTFIANVALGSVSVFRFMHPLRPKQQPPAHAYPQGGYPYPPQRGYYDDPTTPGRG